MPEEPGNLSAFILFYKCLHLLLGLAGIGVAHIPQRFNEQLGNLVLIFWSL
jgi:hypothetical protein